MDIKDKIEKIIQGENLNSAQFAMEIGIQGSTLSHILNGRNNPSLDVIIKILNRFPKISSEWLVSDKGSMYRAEKQSQTPSLFDDIDVNKTKSSVYYDRIDKNPITNSEPIQTKNVNIQNSPPLDIPIAQENHYKPQEISKIVKKIIVYYSDNTFQELETK